MAKDKYAREKLKVSVVPFFIIESNKNNIDENEVEIRPVSFSGAQPSDLIADQLINASIDNVSKN